MSNSLPRNPAKTKEERSKPRPTFAPGYQQPTSRTKTKRPSAQSPNVSPWINTLRTTQDKPVPSRDPSRSTQPKRKPTKSIQHQQRAQTCTRGTQTTQQDKPAQIPEQRLAEQPQKEDIDTHVAPDTVGISTDRTNKTQKPEKVSTAEEPKSIFQRFAQKFSKMTPKEKNSKHK